MFDLDLDSISIAILKYPASQVHDTFIDSTLLEHLPFCTQLLGFSHPCPAPGMLVDTPRRAQTRTDNRIMALTAASWHCCDDLVENLYIYNL